MRRAARSLSQDLLERHRVGARRRRASAARTSRTGSSPRRRWSPRAGCCSCSRCGRRGAARARDWRASRRASRSGALEQPHAVVERQPLAGVELVGDVGRGRRCEVVDACLDRLAWSRYAPMPDADARAQPSRDAEDLDPQRARARAVELGHQDALPLAEHHFAAADLQREAVAEQHARAGASRRSCDRSRSDRDCCASTRRRARPSVRGSA